MDNPANGDSVERAVEKARGTAADAADNRWFEYVSRVGYVMSGLVHAMIGWICLRLGIWGSSGESADQSGALASYADAPAGAVLLVVGGVAMAALALMHVLDIPFGRVRSSGRKAFNSAKALGKAGVYAVLAWTALRFGLGSGSDSAETAEEAAAPFLGSMVGRGLVLIAGMTIIAIGVYHAYKGITHSFREDLNPAGDHAVAATIDKTGLVGYVAKGVALGGVGIMVMWAAISADPDKARGMDAAFDEMRSLPAGGILLAAIGIGFLMFGVYSGLRAKYQQM
ncbi:DUF1206 domain-containing protein [Flaviflexus huanghaiensis]|uniref:DUF1206 domain-containing protein n=1 Tax=Flaviflexus huanghaiensis TaxID=1111473 RepID=UPI0015FE28A2|nr:DUF1206 domain-containing protein [Flaviflexus huanghaiensis]